MSTQDILHLPQTILGTNREQRRIRDLERVLRFEQAEKVIHRNNLHTHMLRVGYLSYDLARYIQQNHDLHVNPIRAQRLALYHDDPEVITGDIPTPVKYSMRPQERMKLRKAEEEAVKALATRYFGLNPLSKKRRQYLEYQRDMTKKESTEARIVNIADKMEGLCETIHEIRCGNETFYQILNNYRKFFQTFISNEPLFEIVNADTTYRLTLETIPTVNQVQMLQPISLSMYQTDPDIFWSTTFDENLPGFYKKWLTITAKNLSPTALFPGWKTQMKKHAHIIPSA